MSKYKWYKDNKKVNQIVAEINRETSWARPDEIVQRSISVNGSIFAAHQTPRNHSVYLHAIVMQVNQGDNIDLVDDNRIVKRYTSTHSGMHMIEGMLPSGELRIASMESHQTWIV